MSKENAMKNQMYTLSIGGVQLQSFESVGPHNHFYKSHVLVAHGSAIHITVVATNAAGLHYVIYSDGIVVDLTEPIITIFQVSKVY